MTQNNRASFGLRNIFFLTVFYVIKVDFGKCVTYISIDYE